MPPGPVDPARPRRVAADVVLLGPLALEQRLGPAVAALLAQVAADGVAALVPDHRRGREADRPARSPAGASRGRRRRRRRGSGIEAAEAVEAPTAERHVAARDVLGRASSKRTWIGPARRARDAAATVAVVARRDVRAADRRESALLEGVDEVLEPVRVRPRVVVEVRDDLSGRRLGARVAGRAEAAVLGVVISRESELLGDRRRLVGRAVVDDDHLEVGVVELEEALAGARDRPRAVVAADDDGDARPRRARANGTSAYAGWTARSAGFGLRSRSVSPKSQSSMSCPPRCHSSVHEKTNVPAQPARTRCDSCQSRLSACSTTPLRRLSRPTSARSSGRSPARFCSRARYAVSCSAVLEVDVERARGRGTAARGTRSTGSSRT